MTSHASALPDDIDALKATLVAMASEKAELQSEATTLKTEIVRLRRFFEGGDVVMTAGVRALPREEMIRVLREVQKFAPFTGDNDPYYGPTSARSSATAAATSGRSTTTTAIGSTAHPIPPIPLSPLGCSRSCGRRNTDGDRNRRRGMAAR